MLEHCRYPRGPWPTPDGSLGFYSQLQRYSVFLQHKELIGPNHLVLLLCRPHRHQSTSMVSYVNEFCRSAALWWPCCCKWLFCIELGECPGRVERLLYTNRLNGCYFSSDACLSTHLGQNIDRLSLSMQSRSLKETLERQRGQLQQKGEAHIKPEPRGSVEATDWSRKKEVTCNTLTSNHLKIYNTFCLTVKDAGSWWSVSFRFLCTTLEETLSLI